MRAFWIHFSLASAPLLGWLAWAMLTFGSEAAATSHYQSMLASAPALKSFFKAVSAVGNPIFYLVYAAILLRGILDKRPGLTRTALVYLAVQLVLSLLLVRLLKISLGRPRPGEGLLYHPMTLEPSHHSLPSGHTCEITAASLPLSLWRRGLLLSLAIGVLTGAVGASRVILGWHHISDVFFGWLLGMVGALAIYLFGVQHANR
jgi:undecaprenyl-diphosphatase